MSQTKSDQERSGRDQAERLLWDAVDRSPESEAVSDSDPRLAANVRVVDHALRTIEMVEEPRSMRANVEARLAEKTSPGNVLRPRWRRFGLSVGQLALAAAVLVAVALGGYVALQQGPAVDPSIAVGSIGNGTSTGARLQVMAAGGVRVYLLSGKTGSAVVFQVEGLSASEELRVVAGTESVARLGGANGAHQQLTVAMEQAKAGLRIELGTESVQGHVVADENGERLRWVSQ